MNFDINNIDVKIIAAIIAAITSVITLLISFIFKPIIERKSHISKVEVEHEYEQRKKIKEVLSQYKVHLVNSADILCGRLNNLSRYYDKKWLSVDGNYTNQKHHYFQSTIYRTLSFYAWMRILESKLIYLDTTIATQSDLNFIKYIKAMRRTLQRGNLTKGIQKEEDKPNDLIFRDTLDEMCIWMIKDESVISFTEFKLGLKDHLEKFISLCKFFDGISPDEDRRRWDRLYCIQLILLSFLNSYGYDFQQHSKKTFEEQIGRIKKYDILPNLIKHLKSYKLAEDAEIKKLIALLNGQNT